MSIIVIRNGSARRVAASEFAVESDMQIQIATNPGVLPLHDIRPGAELAAVERGGRPERVYRPARVRCGREVYAHRDPADADAPNG